jgi:protease-4
VLKSFFKTLVASLAGILVAILIAAFVVPIIFAAIFSSSNWASREPIESRSVLHVLLDGEVVDSAPTFESVFEDGRAKIRLQKLIRAIRLARDDARIAGIVVDMRSPAMGWASAAALRRELLAFKEAKKFSFTYADRLNEMGFYIASGTDRTIMQPNGDVEMDGLASEIPFLKGLFSKLEVKPTIFRVGKFKAAVEPFVLDKMSEENREQTRVLLEDIWSEARKGIAEAAKVSQEELDGWMSGLAIKSVEDAKKVRLVSDVMFTDEFDTLVRSAAGWSKDGETHFVSVARMALEAKKTAKKGHKKLALVIAEGEIVKGHGGRGQIGDDNFMSALLEIQEDPDVAAVVVRINSPGGDALASDILWRQLTVMDEKHPVVASLGDIAASGGYYMAVGARHIVAEPSTITGSIGVFGLLFNAENLFRNKLGVLFDRVATHKHSDPGGITRALTQEEAASIQGSVERTYRRFINVVAQSRGFEKIEDIEALAEGRVWSGTRAVQLGLVDEIGGLDRALAKAAELGGLRDDYVIETFPKPVDHFSKFLEALADGADAAAEVKEVIRLRSEIRTGRFENLPAAVNLIDRIKSSGRSATVAREPISPISIQ